MAYDQESKWYNLVIVFNWSNYVRDMWVVVKLVTNELDYDVSIEKLANN